MSVVFVDPADRTSPLRREGNDLVAATGRRYAIRDGVARFVAATDEAQQQTADSFGFKWNRQPNWGLGERRTDLVWNLWRDLYGFEDRERVAELMRGRLVLDAGCGSGVALRQFAAWPRAIVAVDVSTAVDACRKEIGDANVIYAQADLHDLPFADGVFDVIWSMGVLHHTPDTRRALAAVTRHLRPGGTIVFYVYIRKGPVREFVDDHVRRLISDLPMEDAWRRLEPLTQLGRSLAAIDQPLHVEADVPELGIKAGTYNLQRFVYYNLFKCFWNDALDFDENVHVNYDWYHPKYAHRHTPDEVRGWLTALDLHAQSFHVGESGITVIAQRGGRETA